MSEVSIEPPLCHPHKYLVGIHLKGNEDECLMTTVGHVGGEEDGFSRLRLGNEIDVEAVFFCFDRCIGFDLGQKVGIGWALDDYTFGGNRQRQV